MIPQRCKIEQYFARWDAGADVLACASDVDPLTVREVLALADAPTRSLWDDLDLGYTDTLGHPALREQIAAQYENVTADQVTVCGGGAAEALFLLTHTLLGPGDHAVVVMPAFESLFRIAPAVGATVTAVELDADRGWRLDLDSVRAALRPNTRALFVNFPHNPTGALPTRTEFAELIALAHDAGVTVVSDEVYRYLEYDDDATLPAACDLADSVVSVGVMSKAYAVAGLRIGWIATADRAVTDTARRLKDYTTVCASAPAEILSLIALRAHDELIARSRSIVQTNLGHAESFFGRHQDAFAWTPPDAGLLAFPKLLLDVPVDTFVADLVRRSGVLLLPGTVFDSTDNRFRIGLGRSVLPEAFERMDGYLDRRR